MHYVITGTMNTGCCKYYTEYAGNRQELAQAIDKVLNNPKCNPPEVRQAMYIVEDTSEGRDTTWQFKTKAEALRQARACTRKAKALGIRSCVLAYLEKGENSVFYYRRTTGTKYARG